VLDIQYFAWLNLDEMKKLMPNDTIYITSIRNPIDQFISAYYHLKMEIKYDDPKMEHLRRMNMFFINNSFEMTPTFNQQSLFLGFEMSNMMVI
jgi:hypothetical protein